MNVLETCTNLNSENFRAQAITVDLKAGLAVRAYFDCRPHCLETSLLQKGLVLMLSDKELIEEGIGFGVPVVKFNDKTYFSTSAMLSLTRKQSSCLLTKTYLLNSVSRKRIGKDSYINDYFYSLMRKTFEKFYLRNKKFTPFFNKVMELRDVAKIRTEFENVKPRGKITVNYEISESTIEINADFSDLSLNNCQEILMLNEQGSTFFGKYADSSGSRFVGKDIGAWDLVIAREASLRNVPKKVSFNLMNLKGARLFRGWEKTRNRFSWAGLSYSLAPNNGNFKYNIYLHAGQKELQI